MKSSFGKMFVFNSLFLLAAMAVGYFIGHTDSQRVAVVRSSELIMKNAMIEEEAKHWKNFESQWKTRVLTLEQELDKHIKQFEADKAKLSESQLLERRQAVEARRLEYVSYAKNAEVQSQEKEAQIMNAVLERINLVARQYGEEHGYDIILGANADGNVLYGENAIDITDDLIEALNNEFYDQQ